jgi:hypothetical protein
MLKKGMVACTVSTFDNLIGVGVTTVSAVPFIGTILVAFFALAIVVWVNVSTLAFPESNFFSYVRHSVEPTKMSLGRNHLFKSKYGVPSPRLYETHLSMLNIIYPGIVTGGVLFTSVTETR